ncbi:MAG: bifunctional diaminohydroxyphosphoribosylaminopyrimidine deaminase/5-amino-6-(5-phosphoribosylamino)uracil reductase RibD [Candidatus Norongarragalinales archaeon]
MYSARDPTTKVKGREVLQKAGVKTQGRVLRQEGEKLIQFFKHHALTGRPYVILKTAQTLDGKIATAKGESKWITCRQSREHARRLRTQVDAILVGANTILNDDPRLTSRKRKRLDPLRIILDSKLRIPLDAKALKDANAIWWSPRPTNTLRRQKHSKKKGISVVFMKKISIARLMTRLGRKGILSVLIEGGGNVNFSALKEKTVDKILVYVAPKILGGEKAKTSVEGKGIETIARAIKLEKNEKH